jgi:hypothetical protein
MTGQRLASNSMTTQVTPGSAGMKAQNTGTTTSACSALTQRPPGAPISSSCGPMNVASTSAGSITSATQAAKAP